MREMHPQSPITLGTAFSSAVGFYVYEEAWADQISIGPIVLTGVPITRSRNVTRLGARYAGTLGLSALKRLDLIVDGYNNVAFLRAKKTAPPAYSYNRLGAVFVPTLGHNTNEGVACVVRGSPAYEAGVRNGDVLVKVDNVLVRSWDWSWLHRFSMRAGTKLKLTLRREDKEFQTTATLREILRPNPKPNN